MTMDNAQLRALAATIDCGSFDLAAATLHITPSAVSQRIKALETSAGRVLVRRTKPTEVTDAGLPYLRLARQIEALVQDVVSGSEAEARSGVPLAVNSDSLATWVLPALAGLPDSISFDVRREDQDHSAELLRAGTVMAAITTDARPVHGCSVTRLGSMRYRPMANPRFAARWFAAGLTTDALSRAPMVVFDAKDDLQDRFLRGLSRGPLTPPRHSIPGSADFAEAVRLGLGWGMVPNQQVLSGEADGVLVDLAPGRHVDVVLFWQQWTLHTPVLAVIYEAIRTAAAEHLD